MTANKLTVACIEWKPRMFDVAIHVHPNGAGWAALPAKPQIERNGVVIKRDGKAQYVPVLAFTDRKTADALASASSGPCSISAPKPSTRRLCNDAAEAENAV